MTPDRSGASDPVILDAVDFAPIEFLEAAVRTPSHEDVDGMRRLLADTLERFEGSAAGDFDVTVDDAGCVIAERVSPAPDDGPHLVANTHLDTVTPRVPFDRDRDADGPEAGGTHGSDAEDGDTDGHAADDGRPGTAGTADVIRGRGACDAKGPLAALVYGFLAADLDRGRLTLAVTPDEETDSLGAAALTGTLPGTKDRLDGDLFLVGEPTGLDVCTAAKGRFEGCVELSGRAAHAAESAGANAVAAAEGALGAIRRFDDGTDDHPQLGPPKLTPTVIAGGGATNQVPADCRITVDRRSVPPETAARFRSSLEAAVRARVDDDVGVAVALTDRESPFLEAFATDPDDGFVTTVTDSVRTATDAVGIPGSRGGEVRPFGAATEASYFAPAPTVVFGPGDLADDAGAVAHAEREYVRVREVEAASVAVAGVVDRLLG